MATVLIQHGEAGPDGSPPPRAYFQLIEGKLHMPTIRDYFRLSNIALEGVVYPTDSDGFTFSTFTANTAVRVTGDSQPATRVARILLIRTSEVYSEGEQGGGKRKVSQAEENMGLWVLPPPESQPRTLAELTAALRSHLQIDHSITWLFKYRYFQELVPIGSDTALGEAFDHFRAISAQYSDGDPGLSQHCRLYLNTTSEEMGPRDLIRARITGILDAAAAAGREADPPQPQQPGLTLPLAPDGAAAAVSLLTQHHNNAAAAAALAAVGYGPFLALQQQLHEGGGLAMQEAGGWPGMGMGGGGGGGEGDGDGDDDGDGPGEGGGMGGHHGGSRASGSEGAGGGHPKKESKTRHSDGRFKNEVQHNKKMADMARKITELFDGHIKGLVQVADHKKIMCLLCNHACTAYSAYHTDCVRKHFLRHHEQQLRERSVDVGRWRKEYEVSQKVKRQQQHHPPYHPHEHHHHHDQPPPMHPGPGHPGALQLPPGMGGSMGGMGGMQLPPGMGLPPGLVLNGMFAAAAASAEGEAAQRGLQQQMFQLAGLPVLAADLQQLLAAAGGPVGQGPGVPLHTLSALLQQAQAVSQDEQLAMQAGAGVMAATGGRLGGPPNGSAFSAGPGQPPAAGPGPGSSASAAALSAALSPMARMASGTITTEMQMPQPPIPPQGVGGNIERTASLAQSGRSASSGPGGLPSLASPPVVTTDMSQQA